MIDNGVANYEIRWIFDGFVVSGVDRMLNVDAVPIYQFVTMTRVASAPSNCQEIRIYHASAMLAIAKLHGTEKINY
ncbi:hypothetical protein FE249_19420 (plasmid) [Acidiphilium multivorum]|uniref:hypothetical protein n=1 Tax=Acidiphilium multivorum TaxID=62140 RepID=UPI001F4BFB3D|nr:hypothetical protein [Acidiphilium multivorum]UNC16383.1 hypothetical protein FE249_19420 [Acidiphilium multivorum]